MNDTTPETTPPHRRRPRYRGTHPRRFAEKYKELNPEKFAGDVVKILASGKTLAGTHRPIMVREILDALAPQPGELAVDCTLGYGGHAEELLRAVLPGGRLIALDADPIELPKTEARLRAKGFGPEVFTAHRSNYAGLPQVLAAEDATGADLLLADLGLSSMQMDDPARGFTFKSKGPLDLRMNPGRGQSAAEFLARLTEEQLRQLLEANADEPHAALLAATVVRERARRALTTTTALADAVRVALSTLPKQVREAEGDAPVRRVFQALRIAVNDESGALDTLLRHLPACVRPGGRIAIITFHSGEDRRVKKAFEAGRRDGDYEAIADEVIRPSTEEVRDNPRSKSAKLRWAKRAR